MAVALLPRSSSSGALAAVAAAQLTVGVAGQVVALQRRLPYDLKMPPMAGRPENVARDSWLLGTALSAPIVMLVTQAVATTRLVRHEDRRATRTLATLGTVMISGYLGERVVRQRLRPGQFDAVETSVAVAGLGLATAMAVLGWSTAGS
jgi:hypothetical protein